MLTIVVPASEFYDPVKEEFFKTKEQTLILEHSLFSLAKWEAKWHKAFLSKDEKTQAEVIDYIRCMTVNQINDQGVYKRLTKQNLEDINEYINAPMTATTFSDKQTRSSREIVTAEIIYYWMISLGIPFECQKWHLNRLFTLIRVCSIKNAPSKKMKKRDILSSNHALNLARRNAMGSMG